MILEDLKNQGYNVKKKLTKKELAKLMRQVKKNSQKRQRIIHSFRKRSF